jgi:flagellar hook-associated protein 3 FlgL
MIALSQTRIGRDIARQARLSAEVAKSQIEISTGKRIQSPSDDPVASARISTLRQSQSDHAAWASNLSLGIALADEAGSALQTVSERMAHAKELLIAAASGTASAQDRSTFAKALEDVANEIQDIANSRSSTGSPLFAESATLQFRFSTTEAFSPVPSKADLFEVEGVSLSQLVRDAAASVRASNTAGMTISLSSLDRGIAAASDGASDIGIRAARMMRINEQQISRGIENLAERSSLEDSDLNEAIARLNQQSLTLDAARAAFARINRQTLFDLLN